MKKNKWILYLAAVCLAVIWVSVCYAQNPDICVGPNGSSTLTEPYYGRYVYQGTDCNGYAWYKQRGYDHIIIYVPSNFLWYLDKGTYTPTTCTRTPTTPDLYHSSSLTGVWSIGANGAVPTPTVAVCSPATSVNMASLSATALSGRVLVEWETDSETDNAGFNILRGETENGNYTQVNNALILSTSLSGEGVKYFFVDYDVEEGVNYFYILEDIDDTGVATEHGPVEAKAFLNGDVNGDGKVDRGDILEVKKLMK